MINAKLMEETNNRRHHQQTIDNIHSHTNRTKCFQDSSQNVAQAERGQN